jgi:hypothetical protein
LLSPVQKQDSPRQKEVPLIQVAPKSLEPPPEPVWPNLHIYSKIVGAGLCDANVRAQTSAKLSPLPELLPGGDQFLNCLRAREVPWSDPADEVATPIEVLKHRGAQH